MQWTKKIFLTLITIFLTTAAFAASDIGTNANGGTNANIGADTIDSNADIDSSAGEAEGDTTNTNGDAFETSDPDRDNGEEMKSGL